MILLLKKTVAGDAVVVRFRKKGIFCNLDVSFQKAEACYQMTDIG